MNYFKLSLPDSFFTDEPFFRVLESKSSTHNSPGVFILVTPVDEYITSSLGEQVVSLRVFFSTGTMARENCVRVI